VAETEGDKYEYTFGENTRSGEGARAVLSCQKRGREKKRGRINFLLGKKEEADVGSADTAPS